MNKMKLPGDMNAIVKNFVTESNRIEGITRRPTSTEINATTAFLTYAEISVCYMEAFVSAVQPGAKLRTEKGMDVRVGRHYPPPGGRSILRSLDDILRDAYTYADPFTTHVAYETLHPFMDGNGRSGRVLWAWQMFKRHGEKGLELGFLHQFYYQSLEHNQNDLR